MEFGKTTGFASPAQGYEEKGIDLNELLIKHPAATFFFRMGSDDMLDLGLQKGALLVVDRSKNAEPNDFVTIVHEGQFLCRQLVIHNGEKVFTDGQCYIKPIVDDTELIGVVTACIHVFGYDFTQ
jgi:DNA polymerase V